MNVTTVIYSWPLVVNSIILVGLTFALLHYDTLSSDFLHVSRYHSVATSQGAYMQHNVNLSYHSALVCQWMNGCMHITIPVKCISLWCNAPKSNANVCQWVNTIITFTSCVDAA